MNIKNLQEKHGNMSTLPGTYDAPQLVIDKELDDQGVSINISFGGGSVSAGNIIYVGVIQSADGSIEDLRDLDLRSGQSTFEVTQEMLSQAHYTIKTKAGAFSRAKGNGIKNGRAFIVWAILDMNFEVIGFSFKNPIYLSL
ncbi:hypothetical protein C9I57_13375 [Trinickia symbiotica]|uniref:Uncharacterized protein n=1 Tax=Trinickia symbiotica TaxID=863227 RepID=A0A2T3XUA7_9BURK|nr:hypothetical protein [Trinickia symbiotica]PTB20094.1 hypothetical protein C9I57_13375 [Trinickia symbiotica]